MTVGAKARVIDSDAHVEEWSDTFAPTATSGFPASASLSWA